MTLWTAGHLATLLEEANTHPWESVRAALDGAGGQPHPRIAWLTTHLSVTKREYAALIASATAAPSPPDDAGLTDLMAWEVPVVRALTAGQVATPVTHSGHLMTVADLIRLNARHTVWHAGQIAALQPHTRLA